MSEANRGQTAGLEAYLPPEFHCLARTRSADLEARFGSVDADVQLERERLLAASWTLHFGLMVVGAVLAGAPAHGVRSGGRFSCRSFSW